MAYGDEQEQDFGQSVDTGGGFDPSAGVAGGPEAQPMDSATAISGMADILDQAADDIQNSGMVSNEGAEINTGFDPSAGVVGGPETQPSGLEAQPSASLDSLGDQPSLVELASAIGIDPASLGSGGGAAMGGPESSPQDVIESQVAGEEVGAEEAAGFDPSATATPGEETAAFLSDFNQGMTAQSPEQGLVAKIDALQDQAAQLQAQAGGFDPSAAVAGGAPAQPFSKSVEMARPDNDWAHFMSPMERAQEQVDYEGAAGGWGGNAGWRNPNLDAFTQLEQVGINPLDQKAAYMAANPLGGNKAGMWDNPNTAFTPLENPNYPAWQNPNTVRPPLEGANFPPDWYNVNEQRAYPTAMGGNLPPISAQEAAATATGGGAGWVDPTAVSNIDQEIAKNKAILADMQRFNTSPRRAEAFFGPPLGTGIRPQDASFEELEAQFSTSPETTLAPKYSEETTGYQTHDQMYPNHRNVAAMAGVASIKSMFDGTHKAWIEAINVDMDKREIVLDHEINGVRTGKHSSGNWKEYNDLFTVGEDGVPRDSNGVAMPGTERQAQSGIAGALQGLWGGILSGAEKIFQPKTSSGVAEPDLLETGATTFGADYDRVEPVRSEGDENRGDNPIDVIRSIYPWARSLPNSVLFNAARYPDYLRLLIEADKTGKELPLVVPEWILEGGENPNTNGNGNGDEGNWIANHPAMQTQQAPAGWGSAPWLT